MECTSNIKKEKSRKHVCLLDFSFGGDGGIRTHEPVRANAFRVRPVMTTSIRLHDLNTIPQDEVLRKMVFVL